MLEKAILKINPNASFSINADDINQITWHNGTAPIPNEQILAKIPEVEQEIANQAAQEKGRKESAIAKLKALGLTEEEVKSIL